MTAVFRSVKIYLGKPVSAWPRSCLVKQLSWVEGCHRNSLEIPWVKMICVENSD